MSAAPRLPPNVDHIIYTTPRLEAGMDEMERVLGVRPVAGGRHPAYGTRNAVLSLGPSTYLEVMAPDPELPRPPRGRLLGLDAPATPRLATWVMRTEAIEETIERASSLGLELGELQPGHREKPDGTLVSWRLTDPYANAFDGCLPFLISWGKTAHPAGAAPSGGTLVGLRAEHPRPVELREALAALGVEMDVRPGTAPRLIATIRTPRGDVLLQ